MRGNNEFLGDFKFFIQCCVFVEIYFENQEIDKF